MNIKFLSFHRKLGSRYFSSCAVNNKSYSCKLLVLGGGSGGCSTAAKFASKFGKNEVIIVEPSDKHYYQPMFTLIGGGIKDLSQSWRPMTSVLPKKALWLQDAVTEFKPESNQVGTNAGNEITYEYMIVALGLELHYEKIKGLLEALEKPDSGVCSNYSPLYVNRTLELLKQFKSGNAIFTFPNTPVKCAGAPQKACYISEHYLRKTGKRDKANVMYKTSLPVIFAVKRYANSLNAVCKERNIEVGYRQELVEVDPVAKIATFRNLDKPEETFKVPYELLHVTPPMGAPAVLKTSPTLVDNAGFLSVNKDTLQHTKYKNIFGIGDCTNLPTSKTAAAVAAQSGVLYKNLTATMEGNAGKSIYNGYTSCPLVTGYGRCIMAEFDYNLEPLETFPINQSKEQYITYFMKKDIMPQLYWHFMLKGHWNGPALIRKLTHLGLA